MSLRTRSRLRHRVRSASIGAAVGGLALATLAAIPAADAQELPEQEPGVTLRTYDVQIPLEEVCTLKEGQTPNVDKLMPAIDFADGDFGINDLFVSHTIANLHVPSDGLYNFRLISDDGSFLYIDDEVVIDHDGLHADEPKDGSVELTEGVHPLRIEHFERYGGQVVRLEWQKPGDAGFSLVPTEVLTTDAGVVRVTSPGRKACEGDFDSPGDGLKLNDVYPGYDLVDLRPEGFEPKVTALNWTEDGRMALATWGAMDQQGTSQDGEVYLLDGVRAADGPEDVTVKLVAEGLREPQGLIEVEGDLYVSEKHQLTQLVDTDGDDVVDEYNQVATWPFDGNFHEFAFGLLYREGYFYLNLSVSINYGGATTDPQGSPNRGTHIKVNRKTGEIEYVAGGLRTPNGLGTGREGDVFITDNQGGWLPANKLVHVKPDRFFNHYTNPDGPFDDQPITRPVLWMPHNEIANSPSTPVLLEQGPFEDQMVWGDMTYGGVQRGFIEEVEGQYQGAVFHHSHGLESGINRTLLDPETGALIVGGLGAGGNWGEAGKLTYGLQKLEPNGTEVFDIKAVRAREDGFHIDYTKPLSEETGAELAEAYQVQQWTYAPTANYGGPKIDEETLEITSATLDDDGKTVSLKIDGLKPNRVVHIRSPRPFAAADGEELWGTEAWYTLNEIPGEQPAPVFYEAEEGAILEQGGFDTEHLGYSGGGFIDQLGKDNVGSGTRVTVEVEESGEYDLGIRYANGPHPFEGTKTMSLLVDGEFVKQLALPTTENWKDWAMVHEALDLEAGEHTVEVSVGENDTGHVNLDTFSVRPASERIALFDESGDQQEWQHTDSRDPEWTVEDGAMTVGGGDLRTIESFDDFRVHVEFWLPEYPPDVTGQARANSGVYLQERYEIQVLDSFGVDPLKTNDAAAIYNQKAADVNAATEPETWQSYDIEYQAAQFDDAGNKIANARVSVWWNGTLVQDNVEILHATGGNIPEGPSKGSIRLQDHGNPVKYRNVWIEPLN